MYLLRSVLALQTVLTIILYCLDKKEGNYLVENRLNVVRVSSWCSGKEVYEDNDNEHFGNFFC